MTPLRKYSKLLGEEPGWTDVEHEDIGRVSLWVRLGPLILVSLIVSCILNICVVFQSFIHSSELEREFGAQAVGFDRDYLTTFHHTSIFSQTNRTIQDLGWQIEALRPERLLVALDERYTETLGLPHAMRWPWDLDKGVYLLQSGHELHCLHAFRDVFNDVNDGVEIRWDYPHQLHCLDILLQSTLCNADDTLLYTGYLHENAKHPKSETAAGEGMTRRCRDFDKLRAWADEHSACFEEFSHLDRGIPSVDQYKACPDGSKPWEASSPVL